MKTTLVKFYNENTESVGTKSYTFNIEGVEPQIGQKLYLDGYTEAVIVKKVYDEVYKYYNFVTGDLCDEKNLNRAELVCIHASVEDHDRLVGENID